jgi:Zn-dependent protease with chaperone function
MEIGGFLVYAAVVILFLLIIVLVKSLIEYMYTTPHLKRMKAVPLQDSRIMTLSHSVAKEFQLLPPTVYITHYEVPNAFTLGRKRNPRLIITDGLLDLSYDEVKAVFAHELAHVKSNDSLIKTLASVMQSVFFFDPLIRLVYPRLYVEKEFDADQRSVFKTQKPRDLVTALRKIYKEVSEFGEGLPSQSVLNFSQVVYDSNSIRHQQGIPVDPIVKNRFIVERKMMPGSVVQERVNRLVAMEKRLKSMKRKIT